MLLKSGGIKIMRKNYFKGFLQICKNDRMIGTGIAIGFKSGLIIGTRIISVFTDYGFKGFYLLQR
jgi:hypothetical protein